MTHNNIIVCRTFPWMVIANHTNISTICYTLKASTIFSIHSGRSGWTCEIIVNHYRGQGARIYIHRGGSHRNIIDLHQVFNIAYVTQLNTSVVKYHTHIQTVCIFIWNLLTLIHWVYWWLSLISSIIVSTAASWARMSLAMMSQDITNIFCMIL